jgi:dienelactone hydrolase
MLRKQMHQALTFILACLAVFFLSACNANNQRLLEEDLTFKRENGLEIIGTLYRPADIDPPWPGVLLLHMIYGQRQEWEGLARTLSQNGYAALAIDLRGHGETGGEMNWDLARQDISQVWQTFASRQEIKANSTAVIGASMGANMAVLLGADQPDIQALVLLSPGLNYYMVQTAEPLAAYGDRPVLIIASQEDGYAASSSEELLKVARGEALLEMYAGIGHGTAMLSNQPDLASLLLEWLHPILQSTP